MSLEHFDAYLRGDGKLQRSAGSTTPSFVWHERRTAHHVINVGVIPGTVLTIDLDAATKAAVQLGGPLAELVRRKRERESIARTVAASRFRTEGAPGA